MGRASFGAPLSGELLKLFKIDLDSGGYDDGGAYWGSPSDIYCAQGANYLDFVRATSRRAAAVELNIIDQLKKPL